MSILPFEHVGGPLTTVVADGGGAEKNCGWLLPVSVTVYVPGPPVTVNDPVADVWPAGMVICAVLLEPRSPPSIRNVKVTAWPSDLATLPSEIVFVMLTVPSGHGHVTVIPALAVSLPSFAEVTVAV